MPKIDSFQKVQEVTFEHLKKTVRVNLRPLTINEIHKLLLLARKTGWYANYKLIDLAISYGVVDHNLYKSSRQGIFLEFKIAREIWILTLKSLMKRIGILLSACKITEKNISIKSYKYSDLATPGIIFLIKREMTNIDVRKYVNGLLDFMIVGLKIKGKDYTRDEIKKYIKNNRYNILHWLLDIHIEKDIHKKIPSSIFQTEEERFYVALRLAETLDWSQYCRIIYLYNKVLQNLTFYSNQLGGLDTSSEETKIITAIPAFFELTTTPSSIPIEVCASLAMDTSKNKYKGFSLNDRKYIRSAYSYTKRECADFIKKNKEKISKEGLALQLLNQFASQINKKSKIVSQSCIAYWDEFISHLEYKLKNNFDDRNELNRFLSVPDCYLLVEGISDQIAYSRFLKLFNEYNYVVRIEDCRSKQGLIRRLRDIISKESYIGSIVNVFDSDAEKEYHEAERISKGNKFIKNNIYRYGTLEDLFPLSMHKKILNQIYPSGATISLKDLKGDKPIEKIIKKVLWKKKKASFNKKTYAEVISQNIKRKQQIPPTALEIITTAINLAKARSKKLPKPYSYYSVDKISRKLAQEL